MLQLVVRTTLIILLVLTSLLTAMMLLGRVDSSPRLVLNVREALLLLDTRTGVTTPYQFPTLTDTTQNTLASPDGRWQLQGIRGMGGSTALTLMDNQTDTTHLLGSYSVVPLSPFSIIWESDSFWVMVLQFDNPATYTHLLHFALPSAQLIEQHRYRISPQSWMASPTGNYWLLLGQPSVFPYQRALAIDLATGADLLEGSDVFAPRWSPDGEWLFAEIELEGQRTAQWLHMATNTRIRIPKAGRRSMVVGWSPDSRWTVYENRVAGEPVVALMNLATGLEHVILASPYDILTFWSPQGTRLLIVEEKPSESVLWVTEDDHTTLMMVDHITNNVVSPRWSADEQFIAYVMNTEEAAVVRLIDLQSGSVRDVLHLPEIIFRMEWEDDG
jgi:hypothetical protein